MGSLKVYAYDNFTGREIPSKVGTFPVELVLGGTVSEIHNKIGKSQLFFVFTKLQDADFIVPHEYDKKTLDKVLEFGDYNFNIKVVDNNIWYTKKADTNILISDTIDISTDKLATLLSLYLSEVEKKKKEEGRSKVKEGYAVKNTRNGKISLVTPIFDEAIRECDLNPCCVIINRAGQIVYKSSYGKVAVPQPYPKAKKMGAKVKFKVN